MQAPLKVLLITVLVSIVVIGVALHRYGLLGTSQDETAQKTAAPQTPAKVEAAPAATKSAENKAAVSPPATANLERGRALFAEKTCALCHGANGKADTQMGLSIKATDLSSGQFHSNKNNEESLTYILSVIENGVPGTGMASFKSQIPNEKDRKDLAAYVLSLSSK